MSALVILKLTPPARALRRFVCARDTGEPKRGAFTRVAEYLLVNYKTVANWVHGVWAPGRAMGRRIMAMIAEKISLKPRNSAKLRWARVKAEFEAQQGRNGHDKKFTLQTGRENIQPSPSCKTPRNKPTPARRSKRKFAKLA
jgi:hypothetical protein